MMKISGVISDGMIVVPSTYRSPDFRTLHSFSDSKSSILSHKTGSSFNIGKLAVGSYKSKSRSFMVRCCGQSGQKFEPIAPLQMESPTGQLLMQILHTHPHLLPTAIGEQLENLQKERDVQKEESASSSQDKVLYRRIAEVREEKRQKALEEILYCWIVHKFVGNNISMVSNVSSSSYWTKNVDYWPYQEQKIESVHSTEVFEMIQGHLSTVFSYTPSDAFEVSKVKLGKTYVASIIYGYFLRRVDQRYQLERAIKTRNTDGVQGPLPQSPFWDPDSLIQISVDEDGLATYIDKNKSYKLESYVKDMDGETIQKYVEIRSREALRLIEKQTQAVFGRPDIKVSNLGALEIQNDEFISTTFVKSKMLVLEALTFGSFLWDAEDFVEMHLPS